MESQAVQQHIDNNNNRATGRESPRPDENIYAAYSSSFAKE
jgi:hypothetical protein